IKLGQGVFTRFSGNDGGYVRTNSGGYQILLNYRGPDSQFKRISLGDVLQDRIPQGLFRDRIVLIGSTAESLKDAFYTPYSGRLFEFPAMMSGVALQANIVSQLLSTALDQRPTLKTLPRLAEWAWIFVWALLGAVSSWQFRNTVAITTILLTICGLQGLICFHLFAANGWWLPFVPALLAIVASGILLPLWNNRQRDRLLFRCTFQELIRQHPAYPAAALIGLEYLKQSETKENQRLIQDSINKLKNVPVQQKMH
ncbi:MAG: CHASE2 domain-containing protein, partial [Cyanobacteria bacterium P01_H01_bin.15]